MTASCVFSVYNVFHDLELCFFAFYVFLNLVVRCVSLFSLP